MQRIILILLALTALAACSSNGKPQKLSVHSVACNGPIHGFTMTSIHYGDSRVIVLPVSKVRAGTEFRILLVPKHRSKTDLIDFKTVDVAVSGKPGPSAWISGNGTFNTSNHGMIVVGCVPPGAVPPTTYEYMVKIAGVGQLDPRANVVH